MRLLLIVLVAAAMTAAPAMSEPKRIVVERPPAGQDTASSYFRYEAGTDSTPPRLMIDPGELAYQMKVDSINDAAELKIRKAIEQLERKFEDPKVEEMVGRLIGTIVMEQQLALLDIQIDRALSFRDTLLLKGLELAFQELLRNVPQIREELLNLVNALERRFRELELDLQAVRRE